MAGPGPRDGSCRWRERRRDGRGRLVLRQVEIDSPDEIPDGVLGLEVRLDASPVTADLLAEERLEIRPPRLEASRVDVLGSGQRRRFAGEPVEHARRDRDIDLGSLLLEVADGTEPGDEESREVPEESQRRRKLGGHLDGAKMKQPGSRSAGEGGRDRLGRPGVERWGVRVFEKPEPSRGGDREREASLDRGLARRVTGHCRDGAGSAAGR